MPTSIEETGKISLTREGGHHRDRILHAGGDATGREISRALITALNRVRDDPGIEVIEHALVVDLLSNADGGVCGVTLHVIGEGQVDGLGAAHAQAVVLATGGLGQIYASTTNPAVATGDGMAAALRAGAELADLEFVQFHPTVLYLGEGSSGQQPLISEAVRGEGAFLDAEGVRFMQGKHPLADLAPRDVVPARSSRGCVKRAPTTCTSTAGTSARTSSSNGSHRSSSGAASSASTRRPTCSRWPRPSTTPAEASGPTCTDAPVEGLYACGETSCTGVHGANRLASNSLLEGLVFARRIADDLTRRLAAGSSLTPARSSRRATRPTSLPDPRQAASGRPACDDGRRRFRALGRVTRCDRGSTG